MKLLRMIFIVGGLLVSGTAGADEVVFTNGDRLTGKIKKLEAGKLHLSSEVAGDVVLDLGTVATFASEEPLELHLVDGTVLRQAIDAGESGEVRTAGGETVTAQRVALDALESINPRWGRWAGSVSAGGLATRGNSETETFNAAAQVERRSKSDRITLGAQYLFARQEEDDGEKRTSADAWFANLKYDYFLPDSQVYPYGRLHVERDRIADVDLRFVPAMGLGYQWFEGPTFNLASEAGLAWVYEDFRHEDSRNYLAARLAYHTDWTPRTGVKLFHNFEIVPSLENADDYNTVTDGGLRVSLLAGLFTELKAEWRYDATPAEDADRSDFRYIFSLGWAFE